MKGMGSLFSFASLFSFQIKRLKNHFAIYWKNNFRFRMKNKTQQRQNIGNNVPIDTKDNDKQTNWWILFDFRCNYIEFVNFIPYIDFSIFLILQEKRNLLPQFRVLFILKLHLWGGEYLSINSNDNKFMCFHFKFIYEKRKRICFWMPRWQQKEISEINRCSDNVCFW